MDLTNRTRHPLAKVDIFLQYSHRPLSRPRFAARLGSPITQGTVWSRGFVLESELHYDQSCASALTYLEVLTLHRNDVEDIMHNFPDELHVLRRARAHYLSVAKLQNWACSIVSKLDRLSETRRNMNKFAFGQRKTRKTFRRASISTAKSGSFLASDTAGVKQPSAKPAGQQGMSDEVRFRMSSGSFGVRTSAAAPTKGDRRETKVRTYQINASE